MMRTNWAISEQINKQHTIITTEKQTITTEKQTMTTEKQTITTEKQEHNNRNNSRV